MVIILLYLSLHCHHQNDSCIKMGREESHFNVSLIVGTKSQDDNFFEEKGEPKRNISGALNFAYQSNALR